MYALPKCAQKIHTLCILMHGSSFYVFLCMTLKMHAVFKRNMIEFTDGSKIIRALEIVRAQKLIPNAVL